jgi:hypothetical protein
MTRKFLACLLVTFAVVLAFCGGLQAQSSSPYDGIPIPFDSMPTYPVYRQELLRKGWQPVRLDSVTNSEEFQELVCGNRVCTAEWNHESGRRSMSVLVWPAGYNSATNVTTYRVAPDVE